jgi:hypothetical protein
MKASELRKGDTVDTCFGAKTVKSVGPGAMNTELLRIVFTDDVVCQCRPDTEYRTAPKRSWKQ